MGNNERRNRRLANEQQRREAIAKGEEPPPEIEPYLEGYSHLADEAYARYDAPPDEESAGAAEQLARVDQEVKEKVSTIKERSQMMVHQEVEGLKPGAPESYGPAMHVLRMRARSPEYGRSPSPTMRKINEEWLTHANI